MGPIASIHKGWANNGTNQTTPSHRARKKNKSRLCANHSLQSRFSHRRERERGGDGVLSATIRRVGSGNPGTAAFNKIKRATQSFKEDFEMRWRPWWRAT
jgi:hypothetical protein